MDGDSALFESLSRKEPILKGWSRDRKYRAETADGKVYLLRISPIDRLERKRREFDWMKQAASLGIPMCAPLEWGTCDEGVYTILGWVDGRDAEAHIPALPAHDQYTLGLDAGKILQKLHSIAAPENAADWETRFNEKIDRKIRMYGECPLKYENGQAFLNYLAENRHLLAGRPQSYQHGDYHIGNMMVDRAGKLVIIDFEKADYGDPWEEFNRIVWCAQASGEFARGLVDGYFDGQVPVLFWRLLALYISSNILGSLPWAVPFGQGEIQTMRTQAAQVLAWYDHMRDPVPAWYTERR